MSTNADSAIGTMQSNTGIDTLIVSYTVKELLASLNESVTRIELKLDGKADEADLEALDNRVTQLELVKAKAYGMAALLSFLTGSGGVVAGSVFL